MSIVKDHPLAVELAAALAEKERLLQLDSALYEAMLTASDAGNQPEFIKAARAYVTQMHAALRAKEGT